MKNITCYKVTSGKITTIIKAKSAIWNNTADSEKWVAKNITVTSFTEGNMTFQKADIGDLALFKPPDSLAMASPRPDLLTIKELGQYIDRLREDKIRSLSVETQFHGRISFALAPFIMTLLVVPFGMRFPRTGGIARGIVSGLILGLAYWGFHSGMLNLGAAGHLTPILAAWTANAISIILGIILIYERKGIYG
jgi:lipopolysaccharide export system permease protein